MSDQTTFDESLAERSEGFPKPAAMELLMVRLEGTVLSEYRHDGTEQLHDCDPLGGFIETKILTL